jgi:coenzyme F420 biosynthesis associated uncharacterized protein
LPAPLIDWEFAELLGRRVAPSSKSPWPAVDLAALAADARERVERYTDLHPSLPIPAAEGIDRREWVSANIASMRDMMQPLIERAQVRLGAEKGSASVWTEALASAELGLMLGYMSKRVLGQFEFALTSTSGHTRPPRLLFVLPNLGDAVVHLGADSRQLMAWVALHEVTHAVQFGGVSWLRDYLAGLVNDVMASAERRLEPRKPHWPRRAEVESFRRTLRSGSFTSLVMSGHERATMDRVQAVMAVIEGHAEHVMDAVAVGLLPSLPQLRARLDARRRRRSPYARLISQLLGLELKMRQYEQGKRFCDAVIGAAGPDAQRYLFSAPYALPSLVELQAPALWLRRVRSEL